MQTFIIDAFTDQPFSGNPAGVCVVENPLSEETMQAIAAEINLSETAFLTFSGTENHYFIRYFTPIAEIDFCGHATLASAKLVLERFGKKEVHFETAKKLKLSATAEGEDIKMLFPLYETLDYQVDSKMYEALGIGKSLYAGFAKDLKMLLIEVENKEVLKNLKPDFEKMALAATQTNLLIVTARSADQEYDFYSRCFAPWLGINEDPVTGAAHSVLAKYWAKKLKKNTLKAFQISKRGGYINLQLLNEAQLEVVSRAQIVFEGKLNLKN